ncbi:putative Calcium-binding EF-hand family protein [Melia azedarach]|uniref:Calcium-binding EF-hand family protein n=1 Tax=Melia azedarach TaxID=155640 RepID=A0ACC1Y1A9_MELAZ|nr:putative Calcium-binding EF-hand family protein [Melia azedarach]
MPYYNGMQRAVMPLHPPPGRKPEEKLKRLMQVSDEDGDGRLSEEKRRDVANTLGAYFPGWRAWRAIHYADSDGDGYISHNEFNKLVNHCIKCGYAFK